MESLDFPITGLNLSLTGLVIWLSSIFRLIDLFVPNRDLTKICFRSLALFILGMRTLIVAQQAKLFESVYQRWEEARPFSVELITIYTAFHLVSILEARTLSRQELNRHLTVIPVYLYSHMTLPGQSSLVPSIVVYICLTSCSEPINIYLHIRKHMVERHYRSVFDSVMIGIIFLCYCLFMSIQWIWQLYFFYYYFLQIDNLIEVVQIYGYILLILQWSTTDTASIQEIFD